MELTAKDVNLLRDMKIDPGTVPVKDGEPETREQLKNALRLQCLRCDFLIADLKDAENNARWWRALFFVACGLLGVLIGFAWGLR